MKKSLSGFTLLELLVALTIGGIIAAFAVPSFNTLMQNTKMTSSYNNFVGELNYTRSEAVKRGGSVAICASSNGTSCNTTSWELGRIVFLDTTVNGAVGSTETVIKYFPKSENNVTIRASGFSYTSAVPYDASAASTSFSKSITYGSAGRVSHSGTFFICDKRGATVAKGINVSPIGQTQSAVDSDSTPDGYIDNVNGDKVTCP